MVSPFSGERVSGEDHSFGRKFEVEAQRLRKTQIGFGASNLFLGKRAQGIPKANGRKRGEELQRNAAANEGGRSRLGNVESSQGETVQGDEETDGRGEENGGRGGEWMKKRKKYNYIIIN